MAQVASALAQKQWLLTHRARPNSLLQTILHHSRSASEMQELVFPLCLPPTQTLCSRAGLQSQHKVRPQRLPDPRLPRTHKDTDSSSGPFYVNPSCQVLYQTPELIFGQETQIVEEYEEFCLCRKR